MGSLWKLVNIVCLEKIMGGSLLGSPSCSVDGMGAEAWRATGKGETKEYGKDWKEMRQLMENMRESSQVKFCGQLALTPTP